MDAITKTLLAIDEIARTDIDWREYGNAPYSYEYRSCMRPLPRPENGVRH